MLTDIISLVLCQFSFSELKLRPFWCKTSSFGMFTGSLVWLYVQYIKKCIKSNGNIEVSRMTKINTISGLVFYFSVVCLLVCLFHSFGFIWNHLGGSPAWKTLSHLTNSFFFFYFFIPCINMYLLKIVIKKIPDRVISLTCPFISVSWVDRRADDSGILG